MYLGNFCKFFFGYPLLFGDVHNWANHVYHSYDLCMSMNWWLGNGLLLSNFFSFILCIPFIHELLRQNSENTQVRACVFLLYVNVTKNLPFLSIKFYCYLCVLVFKGLCNVKGFSSILSDMIAILRWAWIKNFLLHRHLMLLIFVIVSHVICNFCELHSCKQLNRQIEMAFPMPFFFSFRHYLFPHASQRGMKAKLYSNAVSLISGKMIVLITLESFIVQDQWGAYFYRTCDQ